MTALVGIGAVNPRLAGVIGSRSRIACLSWLGFRRSLLARGLVGVACVICDAHAGLVAAVEATLLGAAWQRVPRMNLTRNTQGQRDQGCPSLVNAASAIRSIFEQPDDATAAGRALQRVVEGLAVAVR